MNGTSNGSNGASHESYMVQDDSPHRVIESFLNQAFHGGPIARIELSQVGMHGNQAVGDWNSFEGMGPEHVTMQILERAMDDARMQKGSPRYVVTIFRSAERRQSDGRKWFTLAGGGHEFDGVEEMEGPTGSGIIAQLMRHNEASARLALLATRDIIVEQRREIMELRSRERNQTQMQVRVLEAHERLINEEHKRALELRNARFEEHKQEQIFQQIMILLPVVMKLLAGDKSDTIKAAALEQQLRTLFGSMTEQQMFEIMKNLSPAQQMSIMDLNKLITTPPQSPADAIAAKEKKEKAEKEAEEKQKAEAAAAEKKAAEAKAEADKQR